MKKDYIQEVGIDETGRLCIYPATEEFPFIYREAMEVQWEQEQSYLYSPKPREWSYVDWFRQIHAAAKAQGCILALAPQTRWINIPEDLKLKLSQTILP